MNTIGELRALLSDLEQQGIKDSARIKWMVQDERTHSVQEAERSWCLVTCVGRVEFRVQVRPQTKVIQFKLGVERLTINPGELLVIKVPQGADPSHIAEQLALEQDVQALVVHEPWDVSMITQEQLEGLGWIRE